LATKSLSTGFPSALFQKIADYKLLVKFRLNLTVVFSAVMAYLIVMQVEVINWTAVIILALGGFLVTGAANALNQVLERDYDRQMKRTEDRPLPAGRMTVSEAVMAAGLMSMVGIILLSMFNPWTGLLGMLALISYSFIYTPMKRVGPIAVFIGAIPGALPVLIGAMAFQGGFTLLALVLFGIQFFWQFPHFWAVAWLAHEDYAKAGFHLLPSPKGVKNNNAGRQSFLFAMMLIPLTLVPYFLGSVGIVATVFVVLVGLGYAYFSWNFFKQCTRQAALRLMFSSFAYLPLVLLAFWLGKI